MTDVAKDLTGAFNFSIWLVASQDGPLFSNGSFALSLDNGCVVVTSNGGRNQAVSRAEVVFDVWSNISIARDAVGICNIYINGMLSGAANQDSGCPQPGGAFAAGDNLYIDNLRLNPGIFDADTVLRRFNNDPLRDRVNPQEYTTLVWLYKFLHNKYSQYGEDGILAAIFNRIGVNGCICLDAGAADGIWFSNTRHLIEQGWGAILIESNPAEYQKLLKNTPKARCWRIQAHVQPTGLTSIDNIIDRCKGPRVFDLFSLDVDGNESVLWLNTIRHTAHVVVIEHAYLLSGDTGPEILWRDLQNIAQGKGYTVVARTPCNSICVQTELLTKLKDDPKIVN